MLDEATLTPAEQAEFNKKVEKIEVEVAAFKADTRHEDYVTTDANRDTMLAYLNERNQEMTRDTLHDAYEELRKQNKLVVLTYAESKLSAPKNTQTNNGLPPIGKATGADLGVGLAHQQQARRQSQNFGNTGNRDAFIKAAEKLATYKIAGGRRHL